MMSREFFFTGRFWRPTGLQDEQRLENCRGRVLGLRLWGQEFPRGVHPRHLLPKLDTHAAESSLMCHVNILGTLDNILKSCITLRIILYQTLFFSKLNKDKSLEEILPRY